MAQNQKAKARSGSVKISEADIERAKREGPDAVEYYRATGLREARSRSFNIALSGGVSIFGLIFLGWSPLAMLVFIVVDAVITVLADLVRYPFTKAWMKESHARDHKAGRILLIVAGLDDGTAEKPDNGPAPNPGMILFFGVACTVFLLPVIGAATEKIGISALRQVIVEPGFPWIVGVDAVWRLGHALVDVFRVRHTKPGESVLFLECGGVAVLYAGLLVLVWLPMNWGEGGLLAMFFILYIFRLAFGIFAYIWTPRAVASLERRVATNDFSVTFKS